MSLARHSSPMRSTQACFLSLTSLGSNGSVVEQNLEAVGAGFFQAADRPVVEQIAEAAGAGLVVSGLFIGQQQAGILGAALGGGQSPLGIEQDGAGVRGENLGDQRLEFFHHGVADFAAFFLGQRFLQRAALIHGGGGDDAAFVGDFLQTGQFAGVSFTAYLQWGQPRVILLQETGSLLRSQRRPRLRPSPRSAAPPPPAERRLSGLWWPGAAA